MATKNQKRPTTHRTHEGAPASRINPLAQLRRSVLACLLWEDEFYENGESIATRIATLVGLVPPATVAALAIEARTVQHLRHVPLLLVDALAKSSDPARRAVVGATLAQVIQRPDELTEFAAIYNRDKRQPFAAQVKKGLAAAFQKFSGYSLAKYNRDGAWKLRDVLFLCHAKPKDEAQAIVWKALVEGTLAAPDTWEVALSAGKDKRETWTRLITEGQLGGLAMLRNLRNMQQVDVAPEVIRQGLRELKAERVLPFRFIAAARYAPKYEPELEAAMFRNVAELPKLAGKTVLLVDRSGSMSSPISSKSDLTRFDAACGLAMLLREVCEEVVIAAYNDRAHLIPTRRGFALRDALGHPNGGTYTETAKVWADREGYDRLLILTDEQSHQALSGPKAKGYVVNVASAKNGIGYGAWTHIDGWSESVVEYVRELESV